MELIYGTPRAAKTPDSILHPVSRALFHHWEAIRGESTIARKQDLDLKKCRNFLQWLCILERDPDVQRYRWRLAGTGVCRIWGTELTGTDMLKGWPRFEAQIMAQNCDSVISLLQPSVTRFRASTGDGRKVGLEFLALPMEISGKAEPFILGSFAPFRQPSWLGNELLESYEISTMRKIWTDAVPTDRRASDRRPRITRTSTHGSHLQVIDGGRK